MRERKAILRLALRVSFAIMPALMPGGLSAREVVEWKGGHWFNGQTFDSRTVWSDGGVLTIRAPDRIDRSVDLRGGYVTPAFGDAHHHGIDGEIGLEAKIEAFQCAGIFYVKNPNVIRDFLTPALRERLGRADGLDVLFANGGFTNVGGHPGPLHNRLADAGVFPGLRANDMPGRAYAEIASVQALEEAWPNFLRHRPDFVKIFVNGGQAHRSPHTSPRLSRSIIEELVARSHGAGLRVTAHIETAADFAHAVGAGVDELAHAPLVDPARDNLGVYRLDDRAARDAARRKVSVILTASVLPRFAKPGWASDMEARALLVQRSNIVRLTRAGVALAIGSDGISGERPFVTARDEAHYLHGRKLMSNLELLRAWAGNTPRTIFPGRKIGSLREGYEANFLVLDGDPLRDWSATDRITVRVRNGAELAPRCAMGKSSG